MARGRGSKARGRARKTRKSQAVRLPQGKYAWGGRAVSFARLPKKERARFRSVWAQKGAYRGKVERKAKALFGTKGKANKPPVRTEWRDGEGDEGWARFPAVYAVDWYDHVDRGTLTLGDVIRATESRARREGAVNGAFYAKLYWKDEEPENRYSFVSLARGDVGEKLSSMMADFLGEVEEDPAVLDRSKSGRSGTARVVEVGMVLPGL